MKKLSEKQQRLLSAYYDRELGLFQKFYVEQSLLKSPVAQDFLSELSGLSKELHKNYHLQDTANKWNLLNSRLLQVDKNSIYHEAEVSADSLLPSFWRRHPFSTTLATAATAFSVGLVFQLGYLNYFSVDSSLNNRQNIASNLDAPRASTNSLVSSNLPVTLASNQVARSAVELDWVKSDGRIRMIPARNGSANIIWVKAPRNTYLANAQQNK